MSDNLGAYTFLPWLRQGISTQISDLDDGTQVTLRAAVHVDVTIDGGGESTPPVGVDVALFGPADIKAFDTRTITRHWPRADVFEVEPNFFPLLELHPADVAWRYTPAKANTEDRLRPWLGLIVLRDDEIDTLEPPTAQRPTAKLTVHADTPLPLADQLWAWAHVHVDGQDGIDVPGMRGLLDTASYRVVARLLCPRRLDQRTAYTCFLVPTLEAARQAALGLPVSASIDAMTPAWKNDGSAVDLPVFYRWRFQTSDTGDFASLARRIVAQPLPATAGERPMDVSGPGLGLPGAASMALAAESALRALDAHPTDWDPAERQTWTTALAGLLNLPDIRLRQTGAPRTLTPPLYGRWSAATGQLDPTAAPPWFQDLNADPRLRVASALGWTVVQNDQQQLLAGAWAQLDAVRAANTALRQAQLAREAALRLYQRHVLIRPQASIATFTQPLHARVLFTAPGAARPQTIHALAAGSPLRAGVLHPAFTRMARPLGPVGIRQARPMGGVPPTIVERVNTGALPVAPPPATPTQLITPARAGTEIVPPWLTPQVASWLAKIPTQLWSVIEILLQVVLAIWPPAALPAQRQVLQQFLTDVRQALRADGSPGEDLERRLGARDGTLTPQQILTAPPATGFVAQELAPDGGLPPTPSSAAPEDTRFRAAIAEAFGNVNAAPANGETLRPVDLAATAATLAAAIDPATTVAASLGRRLGVLPSWHPADPLDEVMAAPTFPQPMYKPLFDVSPEWILSGLGQLPLDVACLAHPNERFIEAYLLGANDEMGRTLLFNEYPTDQRGSYFRQFWDTRGVPDPAPDINPIAGWPATAGLGGNSTRPGVDAYLVLVLRAELLRRYPNLVVYAVQAQWNPDRSRSVPTANPVELHPEFQGSLGVGARFWGFNLTTGAARGASAPPGPAGWYFAIQEHTAEPRFGLEPASDTFATTPRSWPELAWSDLAPDTAALTQIGYIDLGTVLPDAGAIVDPRHARWHPADSARASDLAYITYREPVRLLVHATRMIPADA